MKSINRTFIVVILTFCCLLPLLSISVSATNSSTNVFIPQNSYEFNGHTYKFFSGSLTWAEAKQFCEDLGGHLATITSSEE